MSKKKTYIYIGPVERFGKIVNPKWVAETEAESPKKALSNLHYRYCRENGLLPTARFEFPGELQLKINSFERD